MVRLGYAKGDLCNGSIADEKDWFDSSKRMVVTQPFPRKIAKPCFYLEWD